MDCQSLVWILKRIRQYNYLLLLEPNCFYLAWLIQRRIQHLGVRAPGRHWKGLTLKLPLLCMNYPFVTSSESGMTQAAIAGPLWIKMYRRPGPQTPENYMG